MRVDRLWNGRRPEPPLGGSVALALDIVSLTLAWSVRVALPLSVPPGRRAFTDRLWEHDVVEIFLAGAARTRYVEIEAAASGHWWAAEFAGPRRRERELRELQPAVRSDWNGRRWTGELEIARTPLETVVGPPPWHGLVALALAAPPASAHGRAYLSSSALTGERPDFHQPEAWPLLPLIEARPSADDEAE